MSDYGSRLAAGDADAWGPLSFNLGLTALPLLKAAQAAQEAATVGRAGEAARAGSAARVVSVVEKAADVARSAPKVRTIRDALTEIAAKATKAAEEIGLSERQLGDVSRRAAHTGTNVHKEFIKLLVEQIKADPLLRGPKATKPGMRGPDVLDPLTGKWWDLTTRGQWRHHVRKYGPGGERIPYPHGACPAP